jgi:DNA-binding SARP family transcriptional activator/tetratricopeptide (TPR) repeat protein
VPYMRFRLLGPFEIEADHGLVEIRRRRERTLLAVLLRHNHTAFSAERLVYLLWDGEPPSSARQQLHTHVSRVRALLRDQNGRGTAARATPGTGGTAENGAPIELATAGAMYRLDADDDAIDARRFERLVAEARTLTDPARRGRRLREALDLWRGDALEGTVSDWLRPRLVADLEELRLAATEEWLECAITIGEHTQLLPELTRLVAAHPAREPLTALSMRALHLAGRSREALDVYRNHQRELAETAGLDPSRSLHELYIAILRGEVEPAIAKRPGPAPTAVVPAQLPSDVPGFSGRGEELHRLDDLLTSGRPVVISALSGTAGIGKTALAVHWAHRAAPKFPDGQLYVNLRGFHPEQEPLAAAEALRGFIDSLGVPPQRVPTGMDAQAGLFRSLVAGRRLLIVLDNARDADQVRPLLPGTAECFVLVTSRNQLTGLVAAEGAVPVALDLLSPAEARALLAGRLGADRLAAEPEAVDQLIDACARLPLALVIVAAHAATQPGTTLAALAAQLRRAHGSLAPFTGDDPLTNVRSVFSWSYRQLSPAAARLFRQLSRHPGPDLTPSAATSLAGPEAADEVAPSLAELTRAHLLAGPGAGRSTFHDLLRAYAGELSVRVDPEPDRRATQRRILDHYLHTAYAASLLMFPQRYAIEPAPPSPGVRPEPLACYDEALAWCTAEHQVLLAAVRQAEADGFDGHAWQLAWTLATYLDRRGHWADWAATQRIAIDAAERLGDQVALAHSHRQFARASTRLGRFDDALANYKLAIDYYAALDDAIGQADTHLNIGSLFERQSLHLEALDHALAAYDLFRQTTDVAGQARSLNNIGWVYAHLGQHDEALTYCTRGLELSRQVGNRYGEATTWDSLGLIHHMGRHFTDSIACYERALDIHLELGERLGSAVTLNHLAAVRCDAGQAAEARAEWRRALAILEELHHPDAEQVRARLAGTFDV